MAATLAAAAAEGFCNSIAGFICGGISTFVHVHGSVQSLENEIEQLVSLTAMIKREIESARSERNKSCPSFEVKVWLEKSENMARDVQKMLDEGLGNGCHVFHRYRMGRDAKRKCLEAKQLVGSCKFGNVCVEKMSPVKAVEKLQAQSLAGQRVAESMLSRLMDCLQDDRVKRVAVWGMGGVGKTTLLKNFNNRLESSSSGSGMHYLLIWVKVSRNVDVRTIQSDIARRLNLQFLADEDTQTRANRLFRRLENRKMKFILVLDDVWERLDLEAVGIPQDHDQANCKIIITTRSFDVCRQMMTDAQLKVDVLNEADSWSLFAQNAGYVSGLQGIEPLARAVARECRGLPLAIKAVALSMRETTMPELWDDALNKLQHSAPRFGSIEKEVYVPLRLSYDSLPSKTHKSCFLCCSLYPESYSIKVSELIQCWIANGVIDEDQTLEQSFNAGTALIEKLKDLCLLEPGEGIGTVRLHDVVRDIAIWISLYEHEHENGFLCQPGISLSEIVVKKLERNFRTISYMNNLITRLPSKLSGCSDLTMLFLQGNPLENINDDFFQDTLSLRVLNLSDTRITVLPSSLLHLGELRALFLRNCSLLERLSPLEALHKLQVLDLSGTGLRELPKEVGKLTNLKELDLSYTHHLEEIEVGAISRLSSLESLNMSFSAYKWVGESKAELQTAAFDELLALKRLSVLHIKLDSVDCIALRFDWLRRLRKFSIHINPRMCKSSHVPTQHDEKRVFLHEVDLLGPGVEGLLCSASALDLINCGGISGLSEIISMAWLDGLPKLKSLTIRNCDWIKNVINGEEIEGRVLPNLECLTLHGLDNLEAILAGDFLRVGFLEKLRKLEVVDCPKLRGMVSYTLLNQVQNLEEVRVMNCKRMKWIFPGQVCEVLKKLKVMEIKDLVSLKYICLRKPAWRALEKIEVSNCPRLERLPLSARNPITVTEIRGEVEWWNNLEWEDYETKSAFQQRFQPCSETLPPLFQEDE